MGETSHLCAIFASDSRRKQQGRRGSTYDYSLAGFGAICQPESVWPELVDLMYVKSISTKGLPSPTVRNLATLRQPWA
jgi:hypothetical protein